jgi:hypothetical protein
MPTTDFETQIDTFVINTKERMLGVVRQSISNVVEETQTPTAKGGRMRVKTGFLRTSGGASLNAPPTGPTRGDKHKVYTWDADSVNVVLAKMKLGDAFYFGWTAHYAKYREIYDGFLEAASQNWQKHVDRAVARFKQKDAGK